MQDLIWIGNRDESGSVYFAKSDGKCWLVIYNDHKPACEYVIPDSLYESIKTDLKEQIERGRFVRV